MNKKQILLNYKNAVDKCQTFRNALSGGAIMSREKIGKYESLLSELYSAKQRWRKAIGADV